MRLSQGGRGFSDRGRSPGPRGGWAESSQAPDGRSGVHQGDSQVSSRQDPQEGSQGSLPGQESAVTVLLTNVQYVFSLSI